MLNDGQRKDLFLYMEEVKRRMEEELNLPFQLVVKLQTGCLLLVIYVEIGGKECEAVAVLYGNSNDKCSLLTIGEIVTLFNSAIDKKEKALIES